MDLFIRKECEKDFRRVEEIIREAFWNLHVPGCDEHYLAHLMRGHKDFLPELDFVAIVDGQIVGNIMYTKSRLVNETGAVLETLTFGPISVLPEFQRKGIGSELIRYSINQIDRQKYKVIVIEGHPYNYCKHGFKGSKSLNVRDSSGKYPYSLLVLELKKGSLTGHSWKYLPSDVYDFDETGFGEFEKSFKPKTKEFKPTQEEFNIASKAFVE